MKGEKLNNKRSIYCRERKVMERNCFKESYVRKVKTKEGKGRRKLERRRKINMK